MTPELMAAVIRGAACTCPRPIKRMGRAYMENCEGWEEFTLRTVAIGTCKVFMDQDPEFNWINYLISCGVCAT